MRNQFPRGEIRFNGKSSADLGIIVSKYPIMRKPARKGTVRTIPGRSGAIVSDTRAYETYVQPYEISIINKAQGIAVAARAVADWLLGSSGYCRLEDDFEPDVFRLARYAGQLDIETIMTMHGTAVIEFDCQPQRYLRSGEQEIQLTEEQQTLYNPTAFAAEPLIRVDMALEGITEEEPVEPVEVELEFADGYYIGNSNVAADNVHRVNEVGSTRFNKVSQAIDVAGYQTAVITAQSYYAIESSASSQPTYIWGLGSSTCYTFLDADGEPCSGITDCYEMNDESVPIPKNAKWLYICLYQQMNPSAAAVTLIPTPPRVGTGKVTINGKTSTIRFSDRSTIYLDCEAHNAYYADGSNANAAVTHKEQGNPFPTFPTLDPGENLVSITGEGVSATISPRWWRL